MESLKVGPWMGGRYHNSLNLRIWKKISYQGDIAKIKNHSIQPLCEWVILCFYRSEVAWCLLLACLIRVYWVFTSKKARQVIHVGGEIADTCMKSANSSMLNKYRFKYLSSNLRSYLWTYIDVKVVLGGFQFLAFSVVIEIFTKSLKK